MSETTAKNNRKFIPLAIKRTLLLLLFAFTANMGISAEERYNVPVVEYFERDIGTPGDGYYVREAFIGVDENGDGDPDVFFILMHIDSSLFIRRLATRIKETGSVSYEDKDKRSSPSLGATLRAAALLEIGGKSVLEIYPNSLMEFPYEVARQERLRSQSRAQN